MAFSRKLIIFKLAELFCIPNNTCLLYTSLLEVLNFEKPTAAQIFGHEPEVMSEIAERSLEFGADMIDINKMCIRDRLQA